MSFSQLPPPQQPLPNTVQGPSGRRPVARHACLACREKKVKCDGEIPLNPGERGEVRHQQCSNCRLLGIECVFVKSQRGGRRKKDGSTTSRDTSHDRHHGHHSHHGHHPSQSQSQPQPSTQLPQPVSIRSADTAPTPSSANTGTQNDTLRSAASFGTSTLGTTPTSSTAPPAPSTSGFNSPPMVHSIRRSFDPPPSVLSGGASPFYNSPMAASEKGSNASGHSLQEKVRQLQLEAADLQSQLLDRSGSVTSSSVSDYFHPRGGPPGMGPRSEMGSDFMHHHGPPGPWGRRGPHGGPPPPGPWGHHHHHHHGPPGPPPHHFGPPMPMHPGSNGPLPPPPGSFPYSSFDEEVRRKRPYNQQPDRDMEFSLPKLPGSQAYISISDEELEAFDLPNWKTTCMLIDLYYRYIHPSRPFLPPKNRLIYQLQVRQDASLIHAMFSSSCRFASSMLLPNANLRDPQHWYFLAEKYWDYMDAETALQALVLLMGALGPGGYIQQSIEGSERTYQVMKISNLLEGRKIADWPQFAKLATKKQVLRHEDMLRTIWGSWKLNVFIRLNRGFPYHKISDKLLKFPEDLPLPQSDTQYTFNLSIFDTKDNHCLERLQYKTWADVQRDLSNLKPETYANFTDADVIIIAIKNMEDIMDTISSGYLNSMVVNQFNSRMKLIGDIANSSLYQISHIKKKTVVLNISKLFALLMVNVARIASNASQCSSILLIRPHETQANSNPDNVLNSLYKVKVEDIQAACANVDATQIMHYLQAFMAALDTMKLVELGMGKVPDALGSHVPITVVGGPVNFQSAAEISSMKANESWWTDAIPEPGKTMSSQVQTYNEFPDVWLQYPIFSVVVIANTLTILASSVVLTKMFTAVKEVESNEQPGIIKVEFIVGQRAVPVVIEKEMYDVFKANFNGMDLHEKITLCSKYIKAHGRFWPYVESTSYQVEAMINYVDDIISRFK